MNVAHWLSFSTPVQSNEDDRAFSILHRASGLSMGDIHIDFRGMGLGLTDMNDRFLIRESLVVKQGDAESTRVQNLYLVEFGNPKGKPASWPRFIVLNGTPINHSNLLSFSWAPQPWDTRYEIAQISGMERTLQFCVVEKWQS